MTTTTRISDPRTTAAADAAALVGRILIAALFIMSGWGKIAGFEGTAGYIASKGLPLPQVGAAIAVVVELIGGLLILVGFKTRWTALVMAVFTIAAGILFHAYWQDAPEAARANYINFWKNVSIAGGFLLLYAFGPGRFSLDRG
jgi:putative oxidoreductase